MSRFWIVAADHASARIFATDKRAGPLEEIASLEHPEGRMKEQELAGGEVGTGFARAGHGQDIMTHENSHKRSEEERFARELADYLDKARQKNRFRELYVLSDPRFLGALRNAMPATVRKMVNNTISKDVTGQSPEQIRKQLPDLL